MLDGLTEVFLMEEDNKNLKGNSDKLRYYRLNDTGNVERRMKLIHNDEESNVQTYYYPQQDRVMFEEKEVVKFSLDQYGQSIPYIEGELTIFNNYFFDFWGYYLNAEGLALYGHLKRFAYGTKDWCFPNFDLIGMKMDKSRKTVHAYYELLERYGFSYKFNVLNESQQNREESPVFKIRKQIPLLSQKLIDGDPSIVIPEDAPAHIKKALKKEQKGLPDRLKKEHEKFVKEHIHNAALPNDSVNYEQIYQAWAQYGEILKNNKPSAAKLYAEEQTKKQPLDMTEEEKMLLKIIMERAEKKFSKASIETWFKDLSLKINGDKYILTAPNEFARDWLSERYNQFIADCIDSVSGKIANIYYE